MVSTAQRPDPTESVRHQLRPLFDQIVIKELDSDRVRRSGLVVPPGSHEPPPQQGIVLAIGPGLDWWTHVGVEMPVQPGDPRLGRRLGRGRRGALAGLPRGRAARRARVGTGAVITPSFRCALCTDSEHKAHRKEGFRLRSRPARAHRNPRAAAPAWRPSPPARALALRAGRLRRSPSRPRPGLRRSHRRGGSRS